MKAFLATKRTAMSIGEIDAPSEKALDFSGCNSRPELVRCVK
jgi:hypothetical protein